MGRTRRKKKVTQKPAAEDEGLQGKRIPKAFVIERGRVGHVLSQLVLDLRHLMEPHTASKLKVRHKNVLKDFVTVAGPLGVTHLLLISHTAEFVNLKVCVLPRGPTITFHVKAFSLTREVLSSLKTSYINPTHFLVPPMLAMNNLSSDNKVCHLMSTVFQNLFPSINVHTVNLASVKRCVLLDFDPDSKLIELRHYAIRVVPRGTSRGVKKLSRTQLPNLGKLSDISEYLLSGYASESDAEDVLCGEGEVTLPQDLPGKANLKSEQSTVRLSELGPRLTLQLVKIEAGVCEGEVLHHVYVRKSRKEQRDLKRLKEGERRLKEARKREQEANVARKKREREEHKARCLAGMEKSGAAGGETSEEEQEEEEEEEEEEEDREWYRKEVGEEPDPDTFGFGSRRQVRGHKRLLKRGSQEPKSKRKKSMEAPQQAKRKKLVEAPQQARGKSKVSGVARFRGGAKRGIKEKIQGHSSKRNVQIGKRTKKGKK